MPIPPFNLDGFLAPFTGASPAESAVQQSPYRATVGEVVNRFSTTPARITILAGWLRYRAALRGIGIRRGFQWLDGSFLEDKDPQDLDIMPFIWRPTGKRSRNAFDPIFTANLNLFSRVSLRAAYHIDVPYTIDLDSHPQTIVDQTRYLLQLFSHQRNTNAWKGMIEVDQRASPDEAALLPGLIARGAGP